MNIKKLTKLGIIAAIYVVLTIFLPFQYQEVQFRIAEILVLLTFYNPYYGISVIIGCLIANFFSPLGVIDIVFGTSHSVLAVIFIILVSKSKIPNLWLASIGVLIGTPLIGWELNIAFGAPFWLSTLWVALGEFAVVTVVGVPLFKSLEKTKIFEKPQKT